ncbi:MAG: cell division protein FtsZ [Deferribacteraceae bacterium]|jgi:cell division protein FtsZ|nr:cell division protein FtsZ [Deferribacteraceae bacterium]
MIVQFEGNPKGAVIKVVGVGGAGGNAVKNMLDSGVEGVEFIVANTDAQVLSDHSAPNKIHLGQVITKGLGAGGDPEIGRKSAIEDAELIADAVKGADIVFITAGMGGGTGTGAAPVIARIAKDYGALTIAVVSTPFVWEGKKRNAQAMNGLKYLKEHVDSYIVVANDRVHEILDKNALLMDGFKMADDVLRQGVQGISDTINIKGHINLDCADVRSIMASKGLALMGMGTASGENRVREALEKALKGPMLADTNIKGAYGILLNITGGNDMRWNEINSIGSIISEYAGDDTDIFFGVLQDGRKDGSISVTLIATGIGLNQKEQSKKGLTFVDTFLDKKTERDDTIINIRSRDNRLRGFEYTIDDMDIPTYLRKQMD